LQSSQDLPVFASLLIVAVTHYRSYCCRQSVHYDNLYSHKSSAEWNRDRQKVKQTINLSYTNIKSIPNTSF